MSDIRTSDAPTNGRYFIRLGCDVLSWAFSILAIGALHVVGVIDNPEIALAGGALFVALRARSKSEVNTAHNKKSGV